MRLAYLPSLPAGEHIYAAAAAAAVILATILHWHQDLPSLVFQRGMKASASPGIPDLHYQIRMVEASSLTDTAATDLSPSPECSLPLLDYPAHVMLASLLNPPFLCISILPVLRRDSTHRTLPEDLTHAGRRPCFFSNMPVQGQCHVFLLFPYIQGQCLGLFL